MDIELITPLMHLQNDNFWHTFLIWYVPWVVENSSQLELLHRTNLLKFSEVAVEKTEVFGNLNNSKTCALSSFILIWYRDQVVFFSWPLEQVSRTNLFKLPKVAVRKNHVFRGLMDSIFDLLLCVFLIWHKEEVVAISDHLEKVCRSNLFEFSVSGIIGNSNLIRHLCFLNKALPKYLCGL